MEVPLADGGGSGGALQAGQDAERPQVHKDEEGTEPPGTDVDDEERIDEVTAEEHATEHGHPYPRPSDDGRECTESNEEQLGVGGKDLAGKFKDPNGLFKSVARLPDTVDPDDRHDPR